MCYLYRRTRPTPTRTHPHPYRSPPITHEPSGYGRTAAVQQEAGVLYSYLYSGIRVFYSSTPVHSRTAECQQYCTAVCMFHSSTLLIIYSSSTAAVAVLYSKYVRQQYPAVVRSTNNNSTDKLALGSSRPPLDRSIAPSVARRIILKLARERLSRIVLTAFDSKSCFENVFCLFFRPFFHAQRFRFSAARSQKWPPEKKNNKCRCSMRFRLDTPSTWYSFGMP